MRRVLILGSLPKNEEKLKLYNIIISICNEFTKEVLSPIDTANFRGSDSERYERAFKTVGWADLIIGEQSEPSTGQGMEIRESTVLKKPLIIIAKNNATISGLVKGSPNLIQIIYYNDLEDLKLNLNCFLNKLFSK